MHDSLTPNEQTCPACPGTAGQAASPSYLSIRAAQLEDLPAMASLLSDSFHPAEGWLAWLSPLMRLGIYQDLRSRLLSNSPNHACLVGVQKRSARQAPAQGWVVGTVEVTLRPLSPWQSYALKSPYISNLAVKTNCRRQGIAQRLLLACERTVREWGLQDLYLHVLDNNQPALQLYLKAGYQLQEADPLWTTYFFKRPRRLLLHKQLR